MKRLSLCPKRDHTGRAEKVIEGELWGGQSWPQPPFSPGPPAAAGLNNL